METEETKNKKSDAALREEKVLEFWRENKTFEKSLAKDSPAGEYVFYDGPPTANGKPGTHHLIPGSFKDAIPRYKTMRGYHVRRKRGWDTHGLPVELQVEKKLGLNSKKAIEEYGIAKFNEECKESVWEYVDLWHKFTERIGFWVDQEHPYVTYHNDFIESVWNVVKKVNEQKLLYKDYRVVPWCPRCGTALSSHELAQGYEDVKDLSVYAKFPIRTNDSLSESTSNGASKVKKYFVAWTTTPWTLPGNVALAVGEDVDYVEAKVGGEILVIAKERLSILTEPYEIVAEHKGKEMIGMEYEPLYPFLSDNIYAVQDHSEKPKMEKAFKVYGADFVTTTDGTGIVHTAVMYGQDDFVLGTKIGLPKHHLVGLDGKFLTGTGIFEGRFVRDEDVAVDVIKDLAHRGLLFKKEKYEHSYPHCWRCHTALIYYARDSWYIKMSDPKIKKEMIEANKEINWEPEHIREGRFGEWLKEIKDWAISRERYWGTPLPIWMDKDNKFRVLGSIEEIKQFTKKSCNNYFLMRHGGSIANDKNVGSLNPGEENDALTQKGMEEVRAHAGHLKKKADIIISSNFTRTRQTAEIVAEHFGIPKEQIILNEELREAGAIKTPDEGQKEIRQRIVGVMQDLEKKYSEKNILIVSHEYPIRVLLSSHESLNDEQELQNLNNKYPVIQNAKIIPIDFSPLPRNNDGQIDLHRPFIDDLELVGENCEPLTRVKEVMDVWFDSGAMPFAQDHYPFDEKKVLYPADFISEAIDQTRGWFYTLHAVGILMGRGKAYKNVICLGHLLDAKGKKMSKSIGNVVDPWEVMDKYGVDTLRLWMYSVNQPGESKNFDEKTVVLVHQQVFGLLYNVLAFYELYRDISLEPSAYSLKPTNVLDQWILARMNELVKLSTENLDGYKLLEPVRAIRDFIGDLSTWYLRRSRDRIKSASVENSGETRDGDNAKETLYFVLKNLAKVMAPFAPFAAEDIWLKLKTKDDVESVHLSEWPEATKVDADVLKSMQIVRDICTAGNAERQKVNIGVRQPLGKLEIKNFELRNEYAELIKEELNVKKIEENKNLDTEIKLDTEITPALKAEGEYREFMRELQDRRKKLGLNPGDKMPMTIEEVYKKYKIPPALAMHMLRVAAVASIICDNFTESIDKQEIVTACLLHDMGNIVKADFAAFPAEFYQPEGIEYLKNVQKEYLEKYGDDEHEPTRQITTELGLSEKIVHLASGNGFMVLCKHRDEEDMNMKIMHYADNRVSPFSIVSYNDRMAEAGKRYENHKQKLPVEERDELVQCGRDIEKQIFAKCKIKPEDINDETVALIIAELKNFVIK